jgi:hypothetical protein
MAYDEHLANRLREIVHAEQGLTEKRMFGGLAFLIDGNMAVSASSQGGLLLRIAPCAIRVPQQRATRTALRNAWARDGRLASHRRRGARDRR